MFDTFDPFTWQILEVVKNERYILEEHDKYKLIGKKL